LVSMKKLALISALLLAASPVAAQVAMSNGQQQTGGQVGRSATTQAPTTGVFCIEEMTATFCNVLTGPNTSGYGSRGVSTSSSGSVSSGVSLSSSAAGGGSNNSSIPPCPSEPPFTNCATDQKSVAEQNHIHRVIAHGWLQVVPSPTKKLRMSSCGAFLFANHASSPLPATLVCRRTVRLFCCPRSKRTGACACLFRGRAGTEISGKAADPR
jgi:hypothetical protein